MMLVAGLTTRPTDQTYQVGLQKMGRATASRHALPRRAQGVILHYDLKGWRGGRSDFDT